MDTIAFPVRFKNNHLSTLSPGSDAYYNQLMALAIQISPGELALDIDYGIRDMTFGEISNASIKQVLSYYFPELDITSVRVAQDVKTSNFLIDISYTY